MGTKCLIFTTRRGGSEFRMIAQIFFTLMGLIFAAVGLVAMLSVGSDIQIILAVAGWGFGLVMFGLSTIIGQLRRAAGARP
jgi:hypothetical protein